jgi:hypothetical protein
MQLEDSESFLQQGPRVGWMPYLVLAFFAGAAFFAAAFFAVAMIFSLIKLRTQRKGNAWCLLERTKRSMALSQYPTP